MLTGGVHSAAELLASGMSRKEIQAQVDAGRLIKVTRGWYASPLAHPTAVHAVRNQARVGCLTGCKAYGLWTPEHGQPHLIVGKGKAEVSPEWHRTQGPLPATPIYPLEECLAQAIRHHDPETALIVLESAVNLKRISVQDAEVLIAGASVHAQRTLRWFNAGAESGTETRVRLFLQRHRFPVQTQVWVTRWERVDMVVGRSLILECDSKQHHSEPEEDRRRDLLTRMMGYDTVRLSYDQVFRKWPETKISLLQMLRERRHLRPLKTSP